MMMWYQPHCSGARIGIIGGAGWYVENGCWGEAGGIHGGKVRGDGCGDNLRVTGVIGRCLQRYTHSWGYRSLLWVVGSLCECKLGGVEIIGCSGAGWPYSDRVVGTILLLPGAGRLVVDRERCVLIGYR